MSSKNERRKETTWWNKGYNGWANEATWRVNLEVFSGIEWTEHVTVDEMQDYIEEYLFAHYQRGGSSELLADFARAYIRQVNMYEIVSHINEEIDLQREYENE